MRQITIQELKRQILHSMRRQFDIDRCRGWHNTRDNGELLHNFLRFVAEWSASGFDPSVFNTKKRVKHGLKELFRQLAERLGQEEIERLRVIGQRFSSPEDSPPDPIQLGGPEALAVLAEIIESLLDFWYLAVHGDYAVAIAEWLLNLSPQPFSIEDLTPLEFFDQLYLRKKSILRWLDEKPQAVIPEWPSPPGSNRRELGYHVHPFVARRLNLLRDLIGPFLTGPVWLTGGAYPRGGRKPPSSTHGTTAAADIDIGIRDVAQNPLPDDIARILVTQHPAAAELVTDERGRPMSLYGSPDFLEAVIFTQAIALTGPSRIYFGDYIVMAAAYGGIYEALGGGYPFRTHFNHDASGHFNHWHVDWLPIEMLSVGHSAPATSVFEPAWQNSCPGRQSESRPIRSRQQLQRPVYIGYPQIPAANDEVLQAVLSSEAIQFDTEDFRLPIGDVEDFGRIQFWLYRFVLSQPAEGRVIH